MDTMIGFSYAALIDPMTSAPSAILGQFYSLFATLVFLLIGGDRLMIEGLAASYRPDPGQPDAEPDEPRRCSRPTTCSRWRRSASRSALP